MIRFNKKIKFKLEVLVFLKNFICDVSIFADIIFRCMYLFIFIAIKKIFLSKTNLIPTPSKNFFRPFFTLPPPGRYTGFFSPTPCLAKRQKRQILLFHNRADLLLSHCQTHERNVVAYNESIVIQVVEENAVVCFYRESTFS